MRKTGQPSFTISNETASGNVPRALFRRIKESVLGKKYVLSVVVTSPAAMKKLNTVYRDRETATDILSFPITETEGEIHLSLAEARKEAKKFDRTFPNFLLFLFIHGCVHLKGYEHGATMERIESKYRRIFEV